MSITLAEDERECLLAVAGIESGDGVAEKALRIIDAQAAALARVEETRKVLCMVGQMSLASRLANDMHMPDPVEVEVDVMFDEEPRCTAGTHGPRNSRCTCEDSRDE